MNSAKRSLCKHMGWCALGAAILAAASICEGSLRTQQSSPSRAAVIPLHGAAGTVFAADHAPSFDRRFVDSMLSAASGAGATVVVLDIASTGGNDDQIEHILEVIRRWSRAMDIVAFVREADGPSAVLAFSCPGIVVSRSAHLRAPQFPAYSAQRTRIRSMIEAAGWDTEIAAGVTGGTLWWHRPSGAFSASPPVAARAEWIRVSSGSGFTATAQQLVACGIASYADTAESLASTLDSSGVPLDIAARLRALERTRTQTLRNLVNAHTEARDGLFVLAEVIGKFGGDNDDRRAARRELGSLRPSLQRSVRLLEGAAGNPDCAVEIPGVVLCQIRSLESALNAIPSDTRKLQDQAERRSVVERISAAEEQWKSCEGMESRRSLRPPRPPTLPSGPGP